MTAEEYFAVTVEGDRTELVDGVMVVDEPRPKHALVQTRLLGALFSWSEAAPGRGQPFSPTDVVLDDHNVYGPDLLWVAEHHLPKDYEKRLEHVPELCVEVRSKSTWRHDIGTKKRTYEARGLAELWLVDHVNEVVLVFRRSRPDAPRFDVELELGAGDTLSSPQLPGFACDVAKLFATP
jgi:Uma2 family endonuclease